MEVNRIEKIIKLLAYVNIIFLILCCLVFGLPNDIFWFLKCTGYCGFGDCIFFLAYYKYLWKFIPWNRPPVLKKRYEGLIQYNYQGQYGKKPIAIDIKQTWLSIRVRAKTDINTSTSISASIVSDHDEYVLYYTYITNPLSSCQDYNPIQYGSCRLVIDEEAGTLSGRYWTSRRTVGDIKFE